MSHICFECPHLTGVTNNGNTRVCRSFTLVVRGTSLSFYMLCSLPNELSALAILVWMSALFELFSATQPKYVNSCDLIQVFSIEFDTER